MPQNLAIYVHWPYCVAKCPYCDFNSHAGGASDEAVWRTAYGRRLDYYHGVTKGRTVVSVFFGGGTPSLMAPETVAFVLERINALWGLGPGVEVTLEANPTTAEAGRFAAFAAAGVNRLSIGVQSFDDDALRFLGRAHDAAQAQTAIELAARSFSNFSFDLIYALPGQTDAQWMAQMDQALAFAPPHLSAYQLTIERGTDFFKSHVPSADEVVAERLFALTQERLGSAGLPLYEISNHAQPDARCRHNLAYWWGEDYLGVGPGAHGRITEQSDGGPPVTRATYEVPNPQTWLDRATGTAHDPSICVSDTQLSAQERATEVLLMGMRLTDGVDRARFGEATGIGLDQFIDPGGYDEMIAGNFILADDRGLRATERGRLLLNAVIDKLVG